MNDKLILFKSINKAMLEVPRRNIYGIHLVRLFRHSSLQCFNKPLFFSLPDINSGGFRYGTNQVAFRTSSGGSSPTNGGGGGNASALTG